MLSTHNYSWAENLRLKLLLVICGSLIPFKKFTLTDCTHGNSKSLFYHLKNLRIFSNEG